LARITVAAALLIRQVAAQARLFEGQGGFTGRLYQTRQGRKSR